MVAHTELGEHLDALERTPDAEPGAPVGGETIDGLAVESHAAPVGTQLTAQAVEQRRLAGAIGPHEAEDLTRLHRHGDVVQRLNTAEALGDRPCFEQGRPAWRGVRGDVRRGVRHRVPPERRDVWRWDRAWP